MQDLGERPAIKAIETAYNGRRFRSRLEARYAVLFDDIGLEYDYETESFEIASGERYLPDFYFPQIKFYGEVKPSLESKDLLKLQRFVKAGLKIGVIMLAGLPRFTPYLVLFHQYVDGKPEVLVSNAILDIHYYPKLYFSEKRLFCDVPAGMMEDQLEFSERYREGVFYALGARFENGETPEVRR